MAGKPKYGSEAERKAAERDRQKRYRQTDKGKASNKKYRTGSAGQARDARFTEAHPDYYKDYSKTPKEKTRKLEHNRQARAAAPRTERPRAPVPHPEAGTEHGASATGGAAKQPRRQPRTHPGGSGTGSPASRKAHPGPEPPPPGGSAG